MLSARRGLPAAGLAALAVWGGACQSAEPRPADAEPATVLVSAAISLADAIGAVADAYERATGTRVRLNLAGSNLLVTQLIAGAPVDVIISADARQMDRAEAAGRIRGDRRVDLLSNQLVVVVPADRAGIVTTVADLESADVERIALGDPDAVPAGVYAREYLESIGLWRAVRDKVVPTRNVRAALAAVAAGTVAAGFVYRTDAATTTGVVRAFEVPIDAGPSIVYPAAVAAGAPNEAEAIRLFEFLRGSEARRLFEEAGFIARQPATSETSGLFPAPSRIMESELVRVTAFTVLMAATATLVMLPPGVALAWLLARRRFPGRSVLETLVSLPLVIPPVATGLILLNVLGRRGPLGSLLERAGVDIVFTWKAVVLAMAVMGLPLLVRAARGGFEQVDRRYEQIAATLGARPGRVFLTISLPLAGRGLLAGAVLGFSRALGEFGATIMIAGALPGTRTLSVAIYRNAEIGQDAAAMTLLAAAVTIGFAAVFLSNRLGATA